MRRRRFQWAGQLFMDETLCGCRFSRLKLGRPYRQSHIPGRQERTRTHWSRARTTPSPRPSVIVGATRPSQLQTNLQALTFTIPAELSSRLERVSRPDRHFPYAFFDAKIQGMIHGGKRIGSKPARYDPGISIEGEGAGVE
jgi:hypothetical protein